MSFDTYIVSEGKRLFLSVFVSNSVKIWNRIG